ncbi:hypothetical protein Athai_38670 [Actinocatenispora thailandica]|uniref:Transposase IS204/IS1001/IS1096/IS1165 DDE domain-containing protein n=1 Tax=Actinocatenispora thailandica TaxID=227318 RepID=A0A7R7HYL7_9ACTN|nr:hypothetical protein Athai_38670 [Actinocatenispora thailandica]
MSDATRGVGFACPDLTTFCRLDELGLVVTGQRLEPDRAVLACRVVAADQGCRRCGGEGIGRDTVIRRLAHEPLGWRPTVLEVAVRRYRCAGCGHVWRQDTTRAAKPRAKLSRRGLRWALEGIVVQHLTVARIAEALDVAWDTANDAVLAEGKRVLIDDPARFEGVKVIGVDEHVWRHHTRRGDKYVTVIIDLTPIRDGTGTARLLDMVAGRSKQVFASWLAEREQTWRDAVEVVAMDGFTRLFSRPRPQNSFPTPLRSWTRSTSCAWPETPWTSAAAASSRASTATAAAQATRIAPVEVAGSRRAFTAIRVARSRNSSGYFFGAAMLMNPPRLRCLQLHPQTG